MVSEFDKIEAENTLADTLDSMSLEQLDDVFNALSTEELIKMTEEMNRQRAEEEARKKEEAKERLKRERERQHRMGKLSDGNAEVEFNKLLADFPMLKDPIGGMHWSAQLVRILTAIDYKPFRENLAGGMTNAPLALLAPIQVVKNHLNRATFDNIHGQINEFLDQNPGFSFAPAAVKPKTKAYQDPIKYEVDDKSDTSADPRWGTF
ncbi:hypothetical protein [Methylobacillus sp.]|uniref:hypothetical protein n=1 Tax=Methylobacillus sp. TaxID=56818 RepID=UPI0012BD9E7B|nr:hypothetical protein [Methylobacillus sp.]MPS48531.1 hypothetical protein [Methylobacillus sp.]